MIIRTLLPALAFLTTQALAQQTPSILQVEVENYLTYAADTADHARLARSATPVTAAPPLNFGASVILADVTKVNGAPAKGVLVIRAHTIGMSPTPNPGGAIGDVTRPAVAEVSWEFLKPDGSPIGNLYLTGFSGGPPPPGSPATATGGALSIVAGTGSFLGARGTMHNVEVVPVRFASQAEDPSRRRANGGGRATFILQITPATPPEIATTAAGPEILHADNSPVSAEKPAKRGEELTLTAKGLGPTTPTVTPGDPFPTDPPALVTTPIEVLVNGQPTPAIEPIGTPSAVSLYRLRFQVPSDIPTGTVTIALRSAWMKGPAVSIPIE